MEEKVFNLMEKMYIEMQDMKKGLQSEMQDMTKGLKSEMQDMKKGLQSEMQDMKKGLQSEIQDLKGEVKGIKEVMATKQDIVRLENKMDENHKALYDGYKQSIEGIQEINHRLDKLTDRVDNQEASIRQLKSVK